MTDTGRPKGMTPEEIAALKRARQQRDWFAGYCDRQIDRTILKKERGQ